MTTKTTITLSPIKRCHGSPNLKKRRLTSLSIHRKQQMNLILPIPTINSSSTILTVSCDKQIMPSIQLPDLINDIVIEQQQRREMIVNIATILRKVGDQVDEQLQVMIFKNKYLSINSHSYGTFYLDKQ
ncbi:unnamed protein product [Adineta steineri]|uniref:Uncharacterized protein n=1 Tax=Adineta steineri TaxID=433720 RepID=A0A813XK22_9BILA|nr:unnamed protein product [Adineta steineri]CAF1610033.1 unnamed protein product [Adineta steineri]